MRRAPPCYERHSRHSNWRYGMRLASSPPISSHIVWLEVLVGGGPGLGGGAAGWLEVHAHNNDVILLGVDDGGLRGRINASHLVGADLNGPAL